MGRMREEGTGGFYELPFGSTLESQFTDAGNSCVHLDRTVAMP